MSKCVELYIFFHLSAEIVNLIVHAHLPYIYV